MKIRIEITELSSGREALVATILKEFGWDFDAMVGVDHCEHSGPAAVGDLSAGEYGNAASGCPRCYRGSSPAVMSWGPEGIVLTTDAKSTKPVRLAAILAAEAGALPPYSAWRANAEDGIRRLCPPPPPRPDPHDNEMIAWTDIEGASIAAQD